jgi:hypothetical protein
MQGLNLTAKDLTESAKAWKFTIMKAIATAIFSSCGSMLIGFISDIELYMTTNKYVGATLSKLSIYMLINSFVVPVAAIALSDVIDNGSERTGLWYEPARPTLHMPGVVSAILLSICRTVTEIITSPVIVHIY